MYCLYLTELWPEHVYFCYHDDDGRLTEDLLPTDITGKVMAYQPANKIAHDCTQFQGVKSSCLHTDWWEIISTFFVIF